MWSFLDNYVDDSGDIIYFQDVLDRDFVKRLLRKLSSNGLTVKILKDTNVMEQKNGEHRRGRNGPFSKWRKDHLWWKLGSVFIMLLNTLEKG